MGSAADLLRRLEASAGALLRPSTGPLPSEPLASALRGETVPRGTWSVFGALRPCPCGHEWSGHGYVQPGRRSPVIAHVTHRHEPVRIDVNDRGRFCRLCPAGVCTRPRALRPVTALEAPAATFDAESELERIRTLERSETIGSRLISGRRSSRACTCGCPESEHSHVSPGSRKPGLVRIGRVIGTRFATGSYGRYCHRCHCQAFNAR